MKRKTLLGIMMVVLSGCHTSAADSARMAITASEQFQAQAVVLFEKYDLQHQEEIARAAVERQDIPGGQRELAEYRKKRDVVVQAFFRAQAITSLGPVLVSLVENGMKHPSDLNAWLVSLYSASETIRDAFNALGVK